MNQICMIAILVTVGSNFLAAQSFKPNATAEKEIVEQFVKMETDGGRLNLDGWEKGRSFFVRSSPFTASAPIVLIGKTYSVWDPALLPDGTTEVTVALDPLGQIDSKLRFKPSAHRYSKSARYFKLVLTDKRWELGSGGGKSKEITESSPRWLIDEPNDTLMLKVDAALRYVSHERDTTTDPIIKRNGEQTLAELRKIRE